MNQPNPRSERMSARELTQIALDQLEELEMLRDPGRDRMFGDDPTRYYNRGDTPSGHTQDDLDLRRVETLTLTTGLYAQLAAVTAQLDHNEIRAAAQAEHHDAATTQHCPDRQRSDHDSDEF
ncbi:hypothetical protein Aca07nite_27820 [Actinoplanes capillaceus]|uniref:Uncharacterized protein n=1 Tax=Actinoplanes campanulatus TaxID=113559 RepID=A0ABQ3WGY5_9ACTN|nr:hypothetical protein [Actinoplanes capillaceus]GID45507.1 hypothetical protein Aca07nite_27820 [Actinoplanes capillaceus]